MNRLPRQLLAICVALLTGSPKLALKAILRNPEHLCPTCRMTKRDQHVCRGRTAGPCVFVLQGEIVELLGTSYHTIRVKGALVGKAPDIHTLIIESGGSVHSATCGPHSIAHLTTAPVRHPGGP